MRTVLAWTAALLLALPLSATAQDARGTLAAGATALGADRLKSIEYSGSGVTFAFGQSPAPGQPWPRLNVKSFTRSVNYETASLHDAIIRTQGDNPIRGGGQQPIRGEQRQSLLSGDHAWNVIGPTVVPASIALVERQLQLCVHGRVVVFAVAGRMRVRAALNQQNLVERVEATVPHPVLGDTPIEVTYTEYRDFAGVKFPTRVRQSAGGFPTLDLTVTDVKPNVAVDVTVPDSARQSAGFYARVATQMVADGVWYLTGGSHHSVVIEMKDHLVVVEGPLNDERALAVIAEARTLGSGKPIRYVVNSHHHFDHSGGLRAFAAEGATVITHETNRAFFERVLAAPATLAPDHMAKSGRTPGVEGVRDRRVLTDGARTVELHHIAGNAHADGLLLVYLPKERLVSETDVFTPPPAGTPPPMPPSPFTLNFADTLKRLTLAVDRVLPLHGRIVPIADLHTAVGHGH